jgi:hypothetical protein
MPAGAPAFPKQRQLDPDRVRAANDVERQPAAARVPERDAQIVMTPQRLAVGRAQEIAGPEAAPGGRTGRVDVAHEQSRQRGEPDRAASLEGHVRAVDHETEFEREAIIGTGILEAREQFAEQVTQLRLLALGQPGEQSI